MPAKLRYASTLYDSVSSLDGVIVANSQNNLEGNNGSGANAALGAGDYIRLLKPHDTNNGEYIAEVMEVVSVNPNAGRLEITVQRDDSLFSGTPSEISGVWAWNGSAMAVTATAATNYDFEAGTVIENLDANALLRAVSAGATGDDYLLQKAQGQVQFVNIGNTGSANFAVDAGMQVSFFGAYKANASKRVHIGKKQTLLEFEVDLEHPYPDDRYFRVKFWKVAITPETVDFQFQAEDWIGAELQMDALTSPKPEHAEGPVGYFDIENDPITLLPVEDRTDSYSAGVYRLYLTPTSAPKALARGIPTTRTDVGNVRTGGLSSPQKFLEHVVGIPQQLDKKILIRKDYKMTTTIEELNAENLALLFDGNVKGVNQGYFAHQRTLTISTAPDDYTIADVVYPLGAIALNPN